MSDVALLRENDGTIGEWINASSASPTYRQNDEGTHKYLLLGITVFRGS